MCFSQDVDQLDLFLAHVCYTFQGLLRKCCKVTLVKILQICFGTKWFCYQEVHYFQSRMKMERLQNYSNIFFFYLIVSV